jgi:predicted ATP-grasp superfamily ATP-dependent carboligase
MNNNLLIFGASTRAAAFSALRAGLSPWCADLFADADLHARCPAMRLPARTFPDGFLYLVDSELKGPWMYTGGLENHVELIETFSLSHPLWGNRALAIDLARDPNHIAATLQSAGLSAPTVLTAAGAPPRSGRWLVKPRAGAGGAGIRFFADPNECMRGRGGRVRAGMREIYRNVLDILHLNWSRFYLQEFIEGTSCSAVYVGDVGRFRFLGATRQLVGTEWLHAKSFAYCGSIGALELSDAAHDAFERLGNELVRACHLRGLFGVDCILRDGIPWPVEVNPRYTASVELLEYGAGVAAMALHRAVFERDAPTAHAKPPAAGVVGKAILFARQPLRFPNDGPWLPTLRSPGPIDEMPAFADIPHAGEHIEARRPILTFFTRATSESACLDQLKAIAADLDRWLFEH